MTLEALDPAFHALIANDATLRTVGSGFQFTEGPIWQPESQVLFFSDIPASTRWRLEGSKIVEHAKPSNMGNGMTLDAKLNLLVCEHATSSVARFHGAAGQREVLASQFEGKELNSPNDIVVAKDGAIYFTDPTYGRMPIFGVERQSALGFQGIYRIESGGGQPQLLVPRDMFTQPNGLCFSPDETLLYVNDTEQTNIRVFNVEGGKLTNMRMFASGITDPAKPGAPDGMKCDADGNIWVTAPAGIWIYSPAGKLIGKIAVPEFAANLHWGGSDWRTLFITASTSLYALDVKIGPRREAFMTG
jgi:gluconolactonase